MLFMPLPGVMQTVQRAEFWGAIIVMQAYCPCHSCIDNLNVARSIGRLLEYGSLVKPLPLVKDGDLIALVQYMIRTRGRETVRVTEVNVHAEDVGVQQGRVRLLDQQGNSEADTAADLGRRHQSEVLIDARRRLLKARSLWYPIVLDLHRFMIATARFWSIMMEEVVLPLIPWFGIRGVGQKLASLLVESMSNLHLYLALLASQVSPGFRFMVVVFLVLILLPGLIALVFCLDLLLFSVFCIGQLCSDDMGHFGFLCWNFSSFLRNGLDTGCSVKR